MFDKLFDKLLEGIFESAGREDREKREAYLRTLQEPARELWDAFRSPKADRNRKLQDCYKCEETQDAYLLRYFPFYIELLPKVLGSRNIRLPENRPFTATFFGCGPAPELIGFLRFFKQQRLDVELIRANLVDIDPGSWTHARNIVVNFVVPGNWERTPNIHSLKANIADPKIFSSSAILDSVRKSDLVVFQNCLNEIDESDLPDSYKNIQSTLENMEPGSVAVIIDLATKYPKTDDKLLQKLSSQFRHGYSWTETVGSDDCGQEDFDCSDLLKMVPPIVTDNLFCVANKGSRENCNKLIFKKEISYKSLAFRMK